MYLDEKAKYLIHTVGLSEETINIVCAINGYSHRTMEDILYATTGYRDFDQYDEFG